MLLSLRFASVFAVATLCILTSRQTAEACAPAPPDGAFVQVAEEGAIIVWDPVAKMEHFIRRASFQTTTRGGFGFLVPTPAKPELAEAPDAAFSRLEQLTKPPVVEKPNYVFEPQMLCSLGLFLGRSKNAMLEVGAPPVRVLDAVRVAGYDAVVLEADSARALSDWLREHGYAERTALTEWLSPYVAAHWKITAFKVAQDPEAKAVSTAAVRMSFATERPFFPYREPADQRQALPTAAPVRVANRLLRVFFIGPERVGGSIGEAGGPWPGETIYAAPMDRLALQGLLPLALPNGAWLTTFEDRASPRPGTDDVFFSKSADSTRLLPEPIVVTVDRPFGFPLDLLALAVGAVWLAARGARKWIRSS